MRFTGTGTFQGRKVSITWDDGRLSGDPEAVAALMQLAQEKIGEPVGIPEIELTLHSHLWSPLSTQLLIEKVLENDETWEGEMPHSSTWWKAGEMEDEREGVLESLVAEFGADRQFKEIWVESEEGAALCALINGPAGWLMLLRDEDDAGLSSRNPNYTGPTDAVQEYVLANGQRDEYPLAWALPVGELQRAMEYFVATGEAAPWLHWHDDSTEEE